MKTPISKDIFLKFESFPSLLSENFENLVECIGLFSKTRPIKQISQKEQQHQPTTRTTRNNNKKNLALWDMSDIVSGGEEKGQSSAGGNKEHDEQDEAQTMGKPEKENSIEDVCDNMLEKVIDYMQGELTATCSDYKLLEKLNRMTLIQYADMSMKTKELTESLDDINEKYRALQPFLEQIDHLEDGVQKLEAAAYKLDAYSKQLESRFKKLEKK